ncbi:MAG: sugar ABC transporter permease [Spirochaetaceae bacterium]
MLGGKKGIESLKLFAFICPALIFYTLFVLIPAFGGIWYSFTNWNGLNPNYKIVGLSNYIEIITEDKYFIKSIIFTLKFVIYMVILQNVLALLLALLIENRKKSKFVFRTLFFMPNMISMIISGFIWMFIFTKVLPGVSGDGIFSFLNQTWLGDPRLSFYAVLIVSLWAGVGYLMIIYIAALQSIPAQLIEAASIDGAKTYILFKYIKLPMILPAVTIGIFLSLNSSFKVFEAVFALTGGGPGRSTQVIALNIFEEAFNMSNRYGYASAKAIVLFLIIFAITCVQLIVMKKREVQA